MIKKMLIAGSILVSLILFSTVSISAEKISIKDYENDVLDYVSAEEIIRPNVDINLIEIEQNGKTITVSINVKGIIEDKGTFKDLEELNEIEDENFTIDIVMYTMELYTVDNIYVINYVNNEINITCETEEIIVIEDKSFNVQGSKLTVTFNLLDDDENYDTIVAGAQEINLDYDSLITGEGYWYIDGIPNDIELDVTIDGPVKTKTDKKVLFSADIDSDSSDFKYLWDFGDGNTSTEKNPSHVYKKPGDYQVSLDVEDEYLSAGFDTYSINVTKAKQNPGSIDGDDDKETTSSLLMFVALIVIIAIVGLIVVYFIIKK